MFLSDPRTKTDLFSQVCGKKFSVGGNSNHMMRSRPRRFRTEVNPNDGTRRVLLQEMHTEQVISRQ
jgi:ribosomal protein L28